MEVLRKQSAEALTELSHRLLRWPFQFFCSVIACGCDFSLAKILGRKVWILS